MRKESVQFFIKVLIGIIILILGSWMLLPPPDTEYYLVQRAVKDFHQRSKDTTVIFTVAANKKDKNIDQGLFPASISGVLHAKVLQFIFLREEHMLLLVGYAGSASADGDKEMNLPSVDVEKFPREMLLGDRGNILAGGMWAGNMRQIPLKSALSTQTIPITYGHLVFTASLTLLRNPENSQTTSTLTAGH